MIKIFYNFIRIVVYKLLTAMYKELWKRLDSNKDNKLDENELKQAMKEISAFLKKFKK